MNAVMIKKYFKEHCLGSVQF